MNKNGHGILVAAVASAVWLTPGLAAAQAFTNITASSGVEVETLVTAPISMEMPIGVGAGWIDVDNDGDDDLYLALNGCNSMWLNNGSGQFAPVPDAAGAAACDILSHGVSSADYDNDGDQDIHVANFGQNRLFKNLLIETGTLSFEDVTDTAGLSDIDGAGTVDIYNTASTVWGDYDNDGYLDLYAGNHVAGVGIPPNPGDETEIDPGPGPQCFNDYLWHNNGDGTFTNVAGATGIDRGVSERAGCELAATWSDYDNDGDIDLMVVNDFGAVRTAPNRLFRNDGADGNGGWIFTDVSAPSGFDYAQAGMGIAIGDYNRDGFFDYYMSDVGENEFGVANGDGTFTEKAGDLNIQSADVGIYRGLGMVSWGNAFFDFDGDSWEDLLVCNGGVPPFAETGKWQDFFEDGDVCLPSTDPSCNADPETGTGHIHLNPCYFYRNRGVNFGDAAFLEVHEPAGMSSTGYYRSVAISDIDDDGDVDAYLGNLHGYNALYRNNYMNANGNNWLKVKTVGTLGNRDGIGSRVEAKAGGVTLMREISGGASFMSTHSMKAHFGLAGANFVDLTVRFPSGVTQEQLFLDTNQTVTVTEPQMTATFPADTRLVTEGGVVAYNVAITNHSDEELTRELWFVEVTPDAETLVGSTRSVTLPAGASINVLVRLSDAAAPGLTRYGARLGVNSSVTHRDHTRVFAQAPAN
ncbi:MAG: CRTAC1 family protein [Pseudomonadota bacterium]